MFEDNLIEKYVRENGLDIYKAKNMSASYIYLESEEEFIRLLKESGERRLFCFNDTKVADDGYNDGPDYEKIQELLEKEYKFLNPISDTISSDDYIERLDEIINNQIRELENTSPYRLITKRYMFFINYIAYLFEYSTTEGSEDDYYERLDIMSTIQRRCEADIISWGNEFVKVLYSEKEALDEKMKSDEKFLNSRNKTARAMYYDYVANTQYPHLRAYLLHPTSFKKIPNFHFSFDKLARATYVEQIYENICKENKI